MKVLRTQTVRGGGDNADAASGRTAQLLEGLATQVAVLARDQRRLMSQVADLSEAVRQLAATRPADVGPPAPVVHPWAAEHTTDCQVCHPPAPVAAAPDGGNEGERWEPKWDELRDVLQAAESRSATRRHQRAADDSDARSGVLPWPDPVPARTEPHRGSIPEDVSPP